MPPNVTEGPFLRSAVLCDAKDFGGRAVGSEAVYFKVLRRALSLSVVFFPIMASGFCTGGNPLEDWFLVPRRGASFGVNNTSGESIPIGREPSSG